MDGTQRLKIAVQKSGRLADSSLDLLQRCGLKLTRSKDRLFCYGENMPIDILLVRDDDIPELLIEGVCDLGIVGENVAEEARLGLHANERDPGYRTLKRLDYGACRLAIAVPETTAYTGAADLDGARIATSYPSLLKHYLAERELNAHVVQLSGSVEIAPSLGTADAICDLVSTGATLTANRLREVDTVMASQAVLLGRDAELGEIKQSELERLLRRIDGVLQVKESKYVMLHAPREALDEIKRLLPGAESPTVLPLEGRQDRVAVHAVCRETVFWEHLEDLKGAGASAVLVLPVEKMLD